MGTAPRMPGGSVEKLLMQYDWTEAQGSFRYAVPANVKKVVIKYATYVSQDVNSSFVIDATQDLDSGTLSNWYGSGSGTLRGRRVTYSTETRVLSFGAAGRYDAEGYTSDKRVCPVKEIWGVI